MKTKQLFSSTLFTVAFGVILIIMTIDEPVTALTWTGIGTITVRPGHCVRAGSSCSTLGQTAGPCGIPYGDQISRPQCEFFSGGCVCTY